MIDLGFPIDIVVPFVDNQEPVWRQSYINYCKQHNLKKKMLAVDNERFDNPGLFDYWWRLVDKNMPWVRTIHLIVSNIEQAYPYLKHPKIHVVLHKDIIPKRFLPTFNSTTIELFIPFIEGLAENFIYFNDDMYPLKPLQPTDFFLTSTLPRISFHTCKLRKHPTQFEKVCWNCYRRVAISLKQDLPTYIYKRPLHGPVALLRSHAQECLKLLGNSFYNNVKPFRTEKQVNQYIYSDYLWFKFGTWIQPTLYSLIYTSTDHFADAVVGAISGQTSQMICINDTPMTDRASYDWDSIKQALEEKLK